jgi:FAD:protein FMN transferase
MFIRLNSIFAVVYLILSPGFAHPAEPLNRYESKSVHMGTEWKIVLYAVDQASAEKASKAAFQRVKQFDELMSDYNPKSELMTVCAKNDAEPGKAMTAHPDLISVLQAAQTFAEKTDGAFDITVGPQVKLWRTARKTKELPKADDLKSALELVGYQKLTVDTKANTIRLAKPGMRLDLGGIGKGYAAQQALETLKREGINQALIAASGDISVSDAPPNKEAWQIDIAPISNDRPTRQLKLVNASVSTSGDLFQHVEISGVRYSHLLDPRTGLGMTGRRSATVIAPNGWTADALTKAALLMPPEKAKTVIESFGGAMYLVVKETDDSEEQSHTSEGIKKYGLEVKTGK